MPKLSKSKSGGRSHFNAPTKQSHYKRDMKVSDGDDKSFKDNIFSKILFNLDLFLCLRINEDTYNRKYASKSHEYEEDEVGALQANLVMENDRLDDLEYEIFRRNKSSEKTKRFYVPIKLKSDKVLNIWTLGVNEADKNKNVPVVLLHGFMGGIGVWRFNVDALSESRALYAIDLLGFARSSRPKFSSDPLGAENEFIDSIEEWRKQMNLDKIILLGHSLGGYIATGYALKYPQNLSALALVDPWGFADPLVDKPPSRMFLVKSFFRARYRKATGLFQPKDLMNLSDPHLIYKYFIGINSFKPTSGREACYTIHGEKGFSKNPMIYRFDRLDPTLPVWFIFGGNSWVNKNDGYRAKTLRPQTSKTFIKIIPKAGHNLHAEKPDLFNDFIVNNVFKLVDDEKRNAEISDLRTASILRRFKQQNEDVVTRETLSSKRASMSIQEDKKEV